MKAGLLFSSLLAIATTSSAAPTWHLKQRSALVQHGRRQVSPGCDLSALDNVTLPISGTSLPAPPGDGFYLASIMIGRGVQNYTCGNNSTAAPVSTGAVAILYEASCIGLQDTSLLDSLTSQAQTVSLPADPQEDLTVGGQPLERGGQHYFNSAKQPTFDFTETGDPALGLGVMAVGVKSPAPNAATDVAWLSLNSVAGTTGPIQAIYRMNTANGVAPATCAGQQPGTISVQYAAQYWVYSADA